MKNILELLNDIKELTHILAYEIKEVTEISIFITEKDTVRTLIDVITIPPHLREYSYKSSLIIDTSLNKPEDIHEHLEKTYNLLNEMLTYYLLEGSHKFLLCEPCDGGG